MENININFFFIGDGVCRAKIENLISQYSVNAEITGFMEYGDLLKYLANCDIAVNIFRDKTKVVHSYKFNDLCSNKLFYFKFFARRNS